jgi:hypothetical protein
MANKQTGKAFVVLAAIFVVFAAAMFGLNFVTGPIIEANNASQAYGPLFAVMPEADDFTPVYMADGSVATTLTDMPETVKAVYQETSGLGYALKLATTKGYTGNPIELTLGVTTEGKIAGIQLDAYPETKDFQVDILFVGDAGNINGYEKYRELADKGWLVALDSQLDSASAMKLKTYVSSLYFDAVKYNGQTFCANQGDIVFAPALLQAK